VSAAAGNAADTAAGTAVLAATDADAQSAASETIESIPFEAPSAAKAAHILRELNWGEHYVATEMNSASGSRDIYLYGLMEAARFFEGEAAGAAIAMGRRGTVCWVDINNFTAWIGEVIGDEVLADALIEAVDQCETGFDQTIALSGLINIRIAQLRGIVGP
jgi:hypothetical protein